MQKLPQVAIALFLFLTLQVNVEAQKQAGFGPYSSEESLEHFQIHPDCKVELVASEPDVIDPVHIEFSPDGKLWVVEYSDYPNGPEKSSLGASRIRVLSDEDHDGRYTNPVTFAEKLLFANSLMLWDGGAIVTTDGKILFLKDTDGDGKADHEEVWFKGFVVENPQLRHNHPCLGPDNKIYVANGLRGGNIVPGESNPWGLQAPGKPLSISGMDFCFDPQTGEHEAVSGNGQFGLCFDDWGNRFTCTNRNPCKHIVLEDKYLKHNPRLRVSQIYEDVSLAGELSKLFPISRTWTTSNLHANQFTAACGVIIYRGDALGENFFGNSFTCDPTANLVHRDVLSPYGATFKSKPGREGVEFLATKDEWFRPVNTAHGPDGALYVVDMYRAVIEHPQFMPEELKNRPDLGMGTDKGRIYRITSATARTKPQAKDNRIAGKSSFELVELLKHNNSWQRETARRLIIERNESDNRELLKALSDVVQTSTDARVVNVTASTLRGVVLAEESLRLDVPQPIPENWPRVLEHAVRLSESMMLTTGKQRDLQKVRVMSVLGQTNEWGDDRLAYQVALSMPVEQVDSPAMQQQFRLLSSLAADKSWLRLALLSSVNTDVVQNLQQCDSYLLDNVTLENTDALFAAYEELGGMFAHLPWPDAVVSVPRKSQFELRSRFSLLRGRLKRNSNVSSWRDPLHKSETELFDIAARWADGKTKPDLIAKEAIQAMIWADSSRVVSALADVLRDSSRQNMHAECVQTLAYHNTPVAAEVLFEAYRNGTPGLQRQVISALSRTSHGIETLLNQVEAGKVSAFEVDPGIVKALARNKTYAARVKELLTRPPAQDRLQVIEGYAECLTLDSDPLRGKIIFEKNCATCHKIGEIGVNVAPDISDSRTKTTEFLLTNILDPNRAVDANYFSYTVLDTGGRIHTGVMSSETSTAITLKQPEGKTISLSRDEIDELKNNGVSLMPVGLERTINKQQMADVISFIKNWRYLDGLVPQEVIR